MERICLTVRGTGGYLYRLKIHSNLQLKGRRGNSACLEGAEGNGAIYAIDNPWRQAFSDDLQVTDSRDSKEERSEETGVVRVC